MKLFGKSNPDEKESAIKDKNANPADERLTPLLSCIRTLFYFINEYTLDISEIDAQGFRERLAKLQDLFQEVEKINIVTGQFEKNRETILTHIKQQKAYLGEREAEFRQIIDLMTEAMTGLDNENQDFYGSIRSQGERFEEITRLDDLKRIKNELVREVENMRAMVREKESLDQKRLDALSSQVEVLKKELNKARHTANTDGLTGVYNRKALDNYLRNMVEQSQITRKPFSILMMDLDDFKKLNDTYGHGVGDRMLMAFTQKCSASVRSGDFLARYGGEEFTLILPSASLRNGTKKAKELCRSIASSQYAADDSPNPDVLSITVSIGVGAYRKGDTAKSLLERADQCLYKAKADGKNRVVAENSM